MNAATTPRARADDGDEVLDAGLVALDEALWKERAQLTHLALRAKTAQLVLAGDDRRWLQRSVDDLEAAAREIRANDHGPARLLRAILRHLGRPQSGTLRDLADVAPPAWQQRLRSHISGLDRLMSDVAEAERESRQLAVGGLAAVRGMLHAITGTQDQVTTTYDQRGRAVDTSAHRVDGRI
ncbi:MAG: flagellar export chaperone FlgN [Actinomycetota bacterium]